MCFQIRFKQLKSYEFPPYQKHLILEFWHENIQLKSKDLNILPIFRLRLQTII